MASSVLIVDDDPLLCNLLQVALRRGGIGSHVAYSGSAALEYLKEHPVDLVLLDILMADMSGFDVLEQIRQQPTHRKLPVIILTARADVSSRQRGMASGADAYLVKPVTPDKILDHIRTFLPDA